MPLAIDLPADKLADICRRYHIARLEVFGSAVRDDFGPDSDVDFLVTWEPDASVGMVEFAQLAEELEALAGRPIDLVSRHSVETSRNEIKKREILRNTELVYGR